jgi:hypothetical protein
VNKWCDTGAEERQWLHALPITQKTARQLISIKSFNEAQEVSDVPLSDFAARLTG